VLAYDCFEFSALLGITAIVYPIGIKKKMSPGLISVMSATSDVPAPLAEVQRKVPSAVWMVVRNLQT
jgi:hypothetical protein